MYIDELSNLILSKKSNQFVFKNCSNLISIRKRDILFRRRKSLFPRFYHRLRNDNIIRYTIKLYNYPVDIFSTRKSQRGSHNWLLSEDGNNSYSPRTHRLVRIAVQSVRTEIRIASPIELVPTDPSACSRIQDHRSILLTSQRLELISPV